MNILLMFKIFHFLKWYIFFFNLSIVLKVHTKIQKSYWTSSNIMKTLKNKIWVYIVLSFEYLILYGWSGRKKNVKGNSVLNQKLSIPSGINNNQESIISMADNSLCCHHECVMNNYITAKLLCHFKCLQQFFSTATRLTIIVGVPLISTENHYTFAELVKFDLV